MKNKMNGDEGSHLKTHPSKGNTTRKEKAKEKEMKRNPTALDLCIARAYMLYPYPQDRSLRDPQLRRCVLLLYRQQVGTLPAVVTPIMHSRYQVDKLMSADGKTAATRVRVYIPYAWALPIQCHWGTASLARAPAPCNGLVAVGCVGFWIVWDIVGCDECGRVSF
jgi:hypothetical protein